MSCLPWCDHFAGVFRAEEMGAGLAQRRPCLSLTAQDKRSSNGPPDVGKTLR
jgi:hypothetical protein